jgi:tRNA-binding protein
MSKSEISFEDFSKVHIHAGTVIEAGSNSKARKPAYVMKIDFGELGIKTTSAQICREYQPQELVGKQILAVTNFAPKNVAGIISEVLVLAVVDQSIGTILLRPERAVTNGARVL